jgi:type IV pilus assembly protein PilC
MTKNLTKQEVARFCGQLKLLLASGAPLVQALQITKRLAKETKHYDQMIEKIVSGHSLGEAFKDFFPPLVINSLQSAEQAGNLEEVLDYLTKHYELEAEIEARIKSVLVYPIFVIILSIIALLVLVIFVLPGFKSLLGEMGGELPILTRIMIGVGEGLARFWYLPLVIILPIKPVYQKIRQDERWLKKIDHHLSRVAFLKQIEVMGALRSLGALIKAGVNINRALQTVTNTVRNYVLKQKFVMISQRIENGEPLHHSLEQEQLLPASLCRIVEIGEQTGQLAEVLLGLANYHDQEKERQIKRFTSLLEPILTVVVGLFVALIALSLFMPMTTMLAKLQ